MTVNQKPSGMAKSIPVGLAIGWMTEMILMLLLCAGLTMLILSGRLGRENIGYGLIIVLLTSSYAGASVSCRAIRRRKLLVCALSGTLYMAALLGITALFFGGQYEAVGVTALLVFGGIAVAALTNTTKKTGEKYRRRMRIL